MKKLPSALLALLLFIVPASSSYSLQSYGFGSGGANDASSSQYNMNATTGELSGDRMNSSSYLGLPGLVSRELANTPAAPTFSNVSSDTNKLLLTLDTGGNPSDAEFAVAITDDNWSTTSYVQSDNTVGATLGSEDWQTYANWGSGSGEYVVGLDPDTTYKVKVKARTGEFTEGMWGPEASATTTALSITFDIDVSSSDTETAAPYELDLGSLDPGTVVTASEKIWVDLDTSAASGAYVYVAGSNAGLESASQGYTITAVSGNLTSEAEGFGLQTASVTESSGGPMAAVSPYDGSTENVGGPTTSLAEILSSSNTAVTSGRASVSLKAKIEDITPAANDYAEVLTLVAAAIY